MGGVEMNPAFWRGKRVLLTGHTGFKGTWLALWLARLGAEVQGYALTPPTQPNLYTLVAASRDIQSIEGDIRNLDRLSDAVKTFRPEIVLHLAAQPLVGQSYENPVETFETNIMGTIHVLESLRLHGNARVVLNVTSDKCYENKEWCWGYREDEPMGGHDPYSASKGCSELVTAAYRRSFFSERSDAAIASARAGNVIGGGDWAKDRLVPDIMNAVMSGNPILLRRPNAVRPWQHVLEPLSGYLLLAEKLWTEPAQFSGAWNFGPPDADARTVQWIAERLAELWGENRECVRSANSGPHEAHLLRLDCAKARTGLGWSSRWSLDEALEKIVDWYRVYASRGNIREITLAQIEHYESVCSLSHRPPSESEAALPAAN